MMIFWKTKTHTIVIKEMINNNKYADMQQLLSQPCIAAINIANNYLEADKSNKIVE